MSDSIINGTLLSTSEKVFGLMLIGKQSATMFSPEKLYGKYAEATKDLKSGMSKEFLVMKYGEPLIQSAEFAAKSVNGLGTELDWVDILDKSYGAHITSEELKRAQKYAETGQLDKLADSLRRCNATLSSTQRLRSVRASEISNEYIPFIKSGSRAWDNHIGGFPNVGVIILAAKTFVGKTTVAISLMDGFLNEYPEKEVLFVTLEDMNEGWKARARVILGDRNDEFWNRIHVMEFSENVDQIIEEAARHPKVALIVLDYIDYLADESSLDSYTKIYKTMSTGAKSLAVANEFRSMPIVMLAQFGKTLYKGGVPTPNALPFAGDQYSYQLAMLYHADGDWFSDDDENAYSLPSEKGMGYIIFWKVKNGRPHGEEFPGAIKVPHTGRTGYNLSVEGEWVSLAQDTKREIKRRRK